MRHKFSVSNVIFNYAYQVKKAIKLKKFSFSIFRYFWVYIKDGIKIKGNHLKLELPWITYEAYDFLNSVLKKDFMLYEFGSGGSSLFFAKHVKEVFSVEHDADWFHYLSVELEANGSKYSNLNLRLVLPKPKNESTEAVTFSDKRFRDYDFGDYVNSILDFPDNHFDLIVIDGRARTFCLRNAIPKLKKGGYLLFDNSDRAHYQYELKKINTWKVLESFGPAIGDLSFSQTSIYQKPRN